MKAHCHAKMQTWSLKTVKPALMVASLLVGSLALTACQSTATNSSANVSTNPSITAKKALATALQKQRRSSFSYHSNIEMSRDAKLTDVATKALVVSNQPEQYCEETHDQAYATLLKTAQSMNKEISSPEYDSAREALKQSYLQCEEEYKAWDDNQYFAPSEEALKSPVAPYYQQLFDEIENKTTALDVKKAQLLDAYLLKPLSLNAQGVYQPLAGKFTMLMSAQYFARNNQVSVNQPLYIDFKSGTLYLWADNFALLNSEFADDKLGTKWQNKWLKLVINDGSLPKDFGRAVVKAHLQAVNRTYETAPVSQFSYIDPASLNQKSLKIPKTQLKAMQPSSQIIRRIQSTEQYKQGQRDYISIFYELITNQYPELITDTASAEQTNLFLKQKDLNSKFLVQQILLAMKNSIDRQSDALINEVYSNNSENEGVEQAAANETSSLVQTLYGLDKSAQIQWQHIQNIEMPSKEASNQAPKAITINVLQQYSPVSSNAVFPNLRANLQVPTASNSVDLRDYSREIADYYRSGNGTTIGRLLYGALPVDSDE